MLSTIGLELDFSCAIVSLCSGGFELMVLGLITDSLSLPLHYFIGHGGVEKV